ncbi:MAG: RNA polymerase factor sigma-32 [Candidatus Desulfofervidaceae bacterium]|nr:RNA polymerase factor sigma-32 [Candidatus Desulfofervidaceae bacterium]
MRPSRNRIHVSGNKITGLATISKQIGLIFGVVILINPFLGNPFSLCYHKFMIKNNSDYEENEGVEKLAEEVDAEKCSALPVLEETEKKASSLATPSGTAILQRYLWEISRYPLLTAEEELRLARLYKKYQDREAAFRLITSNLRLVVKIALEFQNFWMSNLMDLIQEGNLGLMMALKRYDPEKGIRFPYYASFWIKAYILKFILDNWRLVKIGTTQAQRKLFYNLQKEKDKLTQLGFEPIPQLIAKRLNVRERDVIEMEQRMGGGELSLDAPLSPNTEDSFQEVIPAKGDSPEDFWANEEIKALLRQKLDAIKQDLSPKERDILELRLLAEKPLTLKAIGKKHGVSRERIRQIESRLLKKIRAYLQKELPDYQDALAINH